MNIYIYTISKNEEQHVERFMRSPGRGDSATFVSVYSGGGVDSLVANTSLGVAPCFCV